MRVERRILLGEPDGESRAAIARALRADGHEVEEAANGADLLLRAGSEMACVHGFVPHRRPPSRSARPAEIGRAHV